VNNWRQKTEPLGSGSTKGSRIIQVSLGLVFLFVLLAWKEFLTLERARTKQDKPKMEPVAEAVAMTEVAAEASTVEKPSKLIEKKAINKKGSTKKAIISRPLSDELRVLFKECKSLAKAHYRSPSGKKVLACLSRIERVWASSWKSKTKQKFKTKRVIHFQPKDEELFTESIQALQIFFFERYYARGRSHPEQARFWREKLLSLKALWKDIKLASRNREKLLDFQHKLLN
jgi:hypothetical protein